MHRLLALLLALAAVLGAAQEAAPLQEAAAPVKEAVAPAKEAVAPVKEAVAPTKEAAAPAKEAAAPAEEAVALTGVAAPPPKGAAPTAGPGVQVGTLGPKSGSEDVQVQVSDIKLPGGLLELPAVNVHVHSDHEKDTAGSAKPMLIIPEKLQGGSKYGVKKPLRKKKKGGGWMGLLLVPLLIQAKLIPLVIAKLKLLAFKALFIGKLALLILAVNLLYGLKNKNDSHQEKDATLAKEHYGYTGSPEYGAWVNRRMTRIQGRSAEDLAYRAQIPNHQ